MELNIKFFTSLFSVFSVTALMAQSAPPATPIDGGLSLLLAGGVAYGIKKMIKNNERGK